MKFINLFSLNKYFSFRTLVDEPEYANKLLFEVFELIIVSKVIDFGMGTMSMGTS